jgi:precorrin-8X/cobalt-precorrin-8 methylmutase
MAKLPQHPILAESFRRIDAIMGERAQPTAEYAILRRIIHSTADFELAEWLRISPGAIACGLSTLKAGTPIITDVEMVRYGCQSLVKQTFGNPLMAAVSLAAIAAPGKTRTETGLLQAWKQYPNGIYVIGNAPTALMALCDRVAVTGLQPSLIIGAPVGFVGVLEAKARLAALPVPQIRIEGHKGGSPIAAAIVNALLVLAWEEQT